jgi:hypothetical protein
MLLSYGLVVQSVVAVVGMGLRETRLRVFLEPFVAPLTVRMCLADQARQIGRVHPRFAGPHARNSVHEIREESAGLGMVGSRGAARALRAKRSWLKEDIARRFGALPPEVAARIDDVESEDQLDAIKSPLDTATAPDQLFT